MGTRLTISEGWRPRPGHRPWASLSLIRPTFIINLNLILGGILRYFVMLLCSLQLGCASYRYAANVKMVSFDNNNLKKGKSIGPIRGQDCTAMILGYPLGDMPTLDRAFINARKQSGALESTGFGDFTEKKGTKSAPLRYVNKVRTENTFSGVPGIYQKMCVNVTGLGYK